MEKGNEAAGCSGRRGFRSSDCHGSEWCEPGRPSSWRWGNKGRQPGKTGVGRGDLPGWVSVKKLSTTPTAPPR